MPQTAEMLVDRGDAGEQVGCWQTGEMLVDRWDAGRRGDASGQGRRWWTGETLADRWDAGRRRCWGTAVVLTDRSGSPATIPPGQEGDS